MARVGRPPGKSSEQTRADIVAAALEQFVRVGYERATNRAIAEGAGVTAGAIYGYFASKTELWVAVVEETIDQLMPRLRAAAESAPTARAALSAIVKEQLTIEQHVGPTRFMASIPVELQRHPELAEAMAAQPGAFYELIVEVVTRGKHNGEISRDNAEKAVAVFIAGMIGLSIHGGTMPRDHAEAAVAGFVELLEGTLFL
ncbi:MAG: TetR/AcrR family transcriptional regulator [Myxococcales bacterium]|nr:TetR/AcrR family transcriptional regulator [Myxococcales bacterium]